MNKWFCDTTCQGYNFEGNFNFYQLVWFLGRTTKTSVRELIIIDGKCSISVCSSTVWVDNAYRWNKVPTAFAECSINNKISGNRLRHSNQWKASKILQLMYWRLLTEVRHGHVQQIQLGYRNCRFTNEWFTLHLHAWFTNEYARHFTDTTTYRRIKKFRPNQRLLPTPTTTFWQATFCYKRQTSNTLHETTPN